MNRLLFVFLLLITSCVAGLRAVDHCNRIRTYASANPPQGGSMECGWLPPLPGNSGFPPIPGRCIGSCYQDYENNHAECVGMSDTKVCTNASVKLSLLRATGECNGSSEPCGNCVPGTTVTPGPLKKTYKDNLCQ